MTIRTNTRPIRGVALGALLLAVSVSPSFAAPDLPGWLADGNEIVPSVNAPADAEGRQGPPSTAEKGNPAEGGGSPATALDPGGKHPASEPEDAVDGPRSLRSVQPIRNKRVDQWITFFTGRGREQFQRWLDRSEPYMDLLRENLRAEGVPEELANLVFVESGFNMDARSRARAVGPWQFIRGTAKKFGLEMTAYKDERRDPELATRAAARYLRRLYEMFDGSWPLVLAAYNAGEGKVLRAMRRQRTDDFWKLRLPRETRSYVPQFLAAMEIASDPERFGFDPPRNDRLRYDEVFVKGTLDLAHLAEVSAVPLEDLTRLNPALVRHRAPDHDEGTLLRVPPGTAFEVQEAIDMRYAPEPLSKGELRTAARAHRLDVGKDSSGRRNGYHVVRRGETLSQIGRRYRASTSRLVRLNGLSSPHDIRAGQRLKIR